MNADAPDPRLIAEFQAEEGPAAPGRNPANLSAEAQRAKAEAGSHVQPQPRTWRPALRPLILSLSSLDRARDDPELVEGKEERSGHALAGPLGVQAAAAPHLSRAFRVSSTLAGLAAGLALIAYGEGLFQETPIEPSPIVSVPPAKIPTVSPAKTSEPAASVTRPRSPSPLGAAAKKRPAGSKRSTSAEPAGTAVLPVPQVEKRPRRNFLGLRTVAGWITGRSKTHRPGEAGR
jgi:hypothetical protein